MGYVISCAGIIQTIRFLIIFLWTAQRSSKLVNYFRKNKKNAKTRVHLNCLPLFVSEFYCDLLKPIENTKQTSILKYKRKRLPTQQYTCQQANFLSYPSYPMICYFCSYFCLTTMANTWIYKSISVSYKVARF